MCSCVSAGCMFASLSGRLFGCCEARESLPDFCATVMRFGCRFAEHSSCLWAPSFTILIARLPFLLQALQSGCLSEMRPWCQTILLIT
ncbi:hypothetical protein GQ55_2G456900 [Panicum hallii var. hallii]|uniref:Uncharacterized protein n=1 Tax=Panicum hallii var. hallii TaxID=1504633 RepID=A0A2T7EZG3_9POAL|nr:hypothetical protein GQ55_2G456900 [Panicum hallii var. hallii]